MVVSDDSAKELRTRTKGWLHKAGIGRVVRLSDLLAFRLRQITRIFGIHGNHTTLADTKLAIGHRVIRQAVQVAAQCMHRVQEVIRCNLFDSRANYNTFTVNRISQCDSTGVIIRIV